MTFAALNTQVGSSFDITYTAKGVMAEISGTYETYAKAPTSLGENLVFGSDGESTKKFAQTASASSAADKYLEMHYTIHNTGQLGFGVKVTVDATDCEIRYSEFLRSEEEPASNFNCVRPGLTRNLYLTPQGTETSVIDIGIRICDGNHSGNISFLLDADATAPQPVVWDSSLLEQAGADENTTIIFKSCSGSTENAPNEIEISNDGNTTYIYSKNGNPIKFEDGTTFANVLCKELIFEFDSVDTSHMTSMSKMFQSCAVRKIDLMGFDTSRVTDMNSMFMYAKVRALNVLGFDTSNVTDMTSMFASCSYLKVLDISNFDTSAAEGGKGGQTMFLSCQLIEKIYVGDLWNLNQYNSMYSVGACSKLVGGNGTKYSNDFMYTGAYVDGRGGQKGLLSYKPGWMKRDWTN